MRTLVLALLVAGVRSQADPSDDKIRATIEKTITWIAAQQQPVRDHEGAVLFSAPGEPRRQTQVYGGAAGILLFLENAAAVFDDARTRDLADACAAGLRASRRNADGKPLTWMRDDIPGAASLYVGDAGIGHAFLVRARLRGDEGALGFATEVGDSLLARGKRTDDRMSFDEQVEIIYGGAGTALFLLELGQETKEARFLDAARAVGHALIAAAEAKEPDAKDAPRQLTWRWQLANNAAYVNFSHGTAGVAYALARIGAATGDAACAEAATGGAAALLAQAITEGDHTVWPVLAGSTRTMGSWCHGPPGTARLFLYLHALSGEPRYLDVALASARWVMAQAPQEASGDAQPGEAAAAAPAFPPSFCCGVAGVLDFFCDLYRATKAPEFKQFARRAGGYLLATAKVDGDGVKWARGASAHPGQANAFQTDLMLGAAGEGLALLRLYTIDRDPDPVRHLPDRRVSK